MHERVIYSRRDEKLSEETCQTFTLKLRIWREKHYMTICFKLIEIGYLFFTMRITSNNWYESKTLDRVYDPFD